MDGASGAFAVRLAPDRFEPVIAAPSTASLLMNIAAELDEARRDAREDGEADAVGGGPDWDPDESPDHVF